MLPKASHAAENFDRKTRLARLYRFSTAKATISNIISKYREDLRQGTKLLLRMIN